MRQHDYLGLLQREMLRRPHLALAFSSGLLNPLGTHMPDLSERLNLIEDHRQISDDLLAVQLLDVSRSFFPRTYARLVRLLKTPVPDSRAIIDTFKEGLLELDFIHLVDTHGK